jgi:GMP synthase (glutamine-hydrolysing)
MTEEILILDFGSQYTQLIARRVRELNVFSEIYPYSFPIEEIKKKNPKGIILSGGPSSVLDDGSPMVDKGIYELGIPILGLCYGLQLIVFQNEGKVEKADKREYGKADLNIKTKSPLVKNVLEKSQVWMSHGDYIKALPKDYNVFAQTENSPYCGIQNLEKKIFGLQFHPEVVHTVEGLKIIKNFVMDICGCSGNWNTVSFIDEAIKKIREDVGDSKVLCALSGGVDSSVLALLLHKALGKQLFCMHIDTGLMRKDESRYVVDTFKNGFNIFLDHIDAADTFLSRLKGVTDPEKKRKIIGAAFIEVFEKESKKFGKLDFLAQGTLYPDVIESVSVRGPSATIKSHHNVGGLPEKMNMKLLEPFRYLFKDEVRRIGRELGLPKELIERHPFPGPGLAVRIIGDITKDRTAMLREADYIFIDEIKKAGIYNDIWQAFAVLLPVQSVGVMGDERTYELTVALRAVTSLDGMTADWAKIDPEILGRVSNRIINDIKGINRVVYDISSKPPATIEWE